MRKAGLATRKYIFTERIDDLLREIYAKPKGERFGGVATLARRLGWGKSTLCKRAAHLGLAREKPAPAWSEREMRILQFSGHLSIAQVVRNLKKAGFHRTETAIIQQRRRFGIRLENSSYYSAASLAECFGVKYPTVAKWINRGYLKAKHSETKLTQHGRDLWLIHHDDVREFAKTYPIEFDLKTVDQLWFLDLVFEGNVGLGVPDALRDREVKEWDEDAA